ncbi:hypothetical protein HPB51_029021 [Rhipicephalus microplus]|uniref:THAP-type domain-containing protein n=1 Tax=Rhipicephalus microplus TaxID=6941 RepID=A0A9J6CVE7_RHIMP|nr:hypothetical protein HPB51_029021 [Rhipicephalus microplus]
MAEADDSEQVLPSATPLVGDGPSGRSVLRGKRLFRIPLSEKDAARRQVWLAIIKREGFVPTAGSRFCEDHFEPDQFEQCRADGRKLLKCNAVPTIPGPGTLAGRKKRWRLNRRAPSATKRRRSSSVSVHEDDDDEEEEEAERLSESDAAEAVGVVSPAERSSSSGWADALTYKALQIRFAAGQRGYMVVREMCLGFPTELQLRHCIKALPFRPSMEEREIRPVGRPQGCVIVTAALCSALKDVLFQVVERCEALGLTVDALVTDLSACSLSLWKQCGISTHPPFRRPVCSTRHPCSTEQSDHRRLMVLADVTYVTKSIIDALIENEVIFLPRDVVENENTVFPRISVKKRKTLDFATKLKAIQLVEASKKCSTVADKFGIPRSTMSAFLKNKADIKVKAAEQRTSGA